MDEGSSDGVPQKPMPESISGVWSAHEERLGKLDTAFVSISGSLVEMRNLMLSLHAQVVKIGDKLETIQLERAAEGGERKAVEGLKQTYLVPAIRWVIPMVLTAAGAWFLTHVRTP